MGAVSNLVAANVFVAAVIKNKTLTFGAYTV
jgi:hypothetical protein